MKAKTKKQYTTVLSQAKKGVAGFALAYGKFIEKTTLEQAVKVLLLITVAALPISHFILAVCRITSA
jgi:hypothetical protein